MERPVLGDGLAQVTFDDAAIYFSEEQWHSLEDFQKKIYKELIREIYETMLALGYRIPKPEIVCRIERGEEPCINSCKKSKLPGSPGEGVPAGSKDSEPVIKVERESPEASNTFHPSEISSSQQERNGPRCVRCGLSCNNTCGMGYHWNTQPTYAMHPADGNHGKQYMAPPPPFFNGSPMSPGYANRGEAVSHPTSPMGYGNVGMVPLSPHYAGYRNVGDPSSQFPMPERSGHPMFGSLEVSQQTPMGPPGSHIPTADHENRSRKEQYPPVRDPFQERRNAMLPCPGCGGFCNNQCRMGFQWEQRRLHHAAPGTLEGIPGPRYTSPPNPYFNGGANPTTFPGMRPPVRHGTPPVNVPGNAAMIQLSPQYPGYRRPGDPKSPNVLPGKMDNSAGTVIHGNNMTVGSPHGQNQGNKFGTVATNSVNHRKIQSMSPLAAIETMPVFATNSSPNALCEQRNRSSAQTVSSSDSNRGTMPINTNKKIDSFSVQGNKVNKTLLPSTPLTANCGQPKPADVTSNRNWSPSVGVSDIAKCPQPPSSTQGVQATAMEVNAVKRPAPQQTCQSGLPAKRASPPVIIVECQLGKLMPTNGGNNQSSVRATPPSSRTASLPSTVVTIGGTGQDPKKSAQQETKEAKRPVPPITISNIRSAGIFLPPAARAKREVNSATSPIIIIDDKDSDKAVPHNSSVNASNNETKKSTPGTSPITVSRSTGDPAPLSSVTNVHPQGVQQGPPVLVNKVQVQQPSPIIVTGGTGIGNQPLPVSVNGNQSIMLTFPVTVGGSGIMLATPVNIAENQVSGIKPGNRIPIAKNTRIVQTNTVPVKPGNVNAKFSPVVTSVIGQTNPLSGTVLPGQAKPITVNVKQQANMMGPLSVKNPNLTNVNGGTLKAVPLTAAGSQPVGQTIPLFVDSNSGLILTGSTVPSKDTVPSGIGNATVVAVNGGVVTGNVAPVALGGKLAFSNITPVNVNGLGNTTFFTMDRPVGIGNGSSVTLTGNTTNFHNKGTLSMNNPTILTLNSGLGINSSGTVGTPITNITSVNANRSVHVAPTVTPTVLGGSTHQNNGIIIRRVGEQGSVSHNPTSTTEQPVVVVETLFKCSECGENFNSLENLTSHQSVHKPPTEGTCREPNSKNTGDGDVLPGATDEDAPTILYTTQGDDGSTVYVVTV